MDFGQATDSKTRRLVSAVIEGFKFQPIPNSCYPNGIHNILKELSNRHQVGIGYSEKKVNRLVRFKEMLGPKLEVIVPNIDEQLRKADYRCYEKTSTSYGELLRILGEPNCSYPLVGVSPEYFKEVAPRYPTKGVPNDHVLICLRLDDEEIIVWDGYVHYLGASVRMEGPVGLVRVSTGRFLELWNDAFDPSWMFWVCKEKTQATKLIDFES